MNWSKLSAIGELVSSIAIVATLIYLAVQTQQNTIALESSVHYSMLAADLQLLSDRASDPERSQLWCKPNLTEVEKNILVNDRVALVRTREFEWLQYHKGLLDQQTWAGYRQGLIVNLDNMRSRTWWHGVTESGQFHPGFVAHINAFLPDLVGQGNDCTTAFM